MFSVWAILACAAMVCAQALLWVRGRRTRMLLAGLSTFPPLPLIGNAHQIFRNPEHFISTFDKIGKIIDEKNMPFTFWIGPAPFIVLNDPVDIKTVNNAFLNKSYLYRFGEDFVGDGIFSAPGELWKHTSKKLAGTFSNSVVAGYQDMFNALAQMLVEQLREKTGNAPSDLFEYFANNTLETIYKITLGKRGNAERSVSPEYLQKFNRLAIMCVDRAVNPLLHLECIFRLTSRKSEIKKCASFLNDVAEQAIEERRKAREEMKANGKLNINKEDHVKDPFRPYVDILLELSETDSLFTTKQMIYEMNTIFFGGHDTLANSLSMTAVSIGNNRDIQDKLYAEMEEIFGDSKRPVEKEDLARMSYCEAVINESLRLYPPALIIMRSADRDLKLNSCTIPAGCQCVSNIWGSGRSTRLWGEDAEQFRPERWLQKDYSKDAVLLAFSYGKRACIGKKYAMAYMKTVLAHCVRELVFTGEEKDLRFKLGVTLRAIDGHLVQVHLRK